MQTLVLFPAFAAILQIFCRDAAAQNFDADFNFQLLIQDRSEADFESGDPVDSSLNAPADSSLNALADSSLNAPADSSLTSPADLNGSTVVTDPTPTTCPPITTTTCPPTTTIICPPITTTTCPPITTTTCPPITTTTGTTTITTTGVPTTTTTGASLEVPSAVWDVMVSLIDDVNLRVLWTPPQNGNASVTGYTVTWTCTRDEGAATVDPLTLIFTIGSLYPCSDCNVSVTWTASGVVDTNPPDIKTITVGPAGPPIKYANATLLRNGAVRVTWSSRLEECLKNYDIFWKKETIDKDSITDTRGDDVVKVTDSQYEFEDVPHSTYFSYCLTAKGGSSKNFTVGNTRCNSLLVDNRPPPPTIDALYAATPGYLTVVWYPAVDHAGILEKFIIKLYNEQTKEYTYTNFTAIPTQVSSSKSLNYQYRTLLKGVKYTVSVAQVSNLGEGPYSDSMSIITAT